MMASRDSGKSRSGLVRSYVGGKVAYLQRALLQGSRSPAALRDLAQLRRAAGKAPGEVPDTWAIEFEGLPDELAGKGSELSPGEWAVHVAFTLYACHQQSQSKPMHMAGPENDFGRAVRKLVLAQHGGDTLEQSQMPRRFAAMVTAQSVQELAHYARQLVGQLRSSEIPIDYARFAGQVYRFQFERTRADVCLEWARGYTRRPETAEESEAGDQAPESN